MKPHSLRRARSTLLVPLLVLSACGREPPTTQLPSTLNEPPALGVALDAEEQQKLGVEVTTLASAAFQPRIEGPASVIDAQAVVGAMADLLKAEADARTSNAALQRARELFRSDAAVTAETVENADRQAAGADAQLRVARARAALGFGAAAPWLDAARREPVLAGLSRGSLLLVSASFPSGFGATAPAALHLRRLGAESTQSWQASEIWAGPANPAVPGPTVLALLTAPPGVGFGERLTASIAMGATLSGTLVPATAVVLAGGATWCYVQTGDGEFVRRRLDIGRPLGADYFQVGGFAAGERIVVAGAGLLLSRELGGGAAAD